MSGDAAATRYMRKGHHEGKTVCEWSAMRSFVVCDQEHTGPEGRGRDLSVYTYDEKARQYRFFNLGQDGHHANPQLAVTGDTVTYTSANENNGRKTIFRTVNKFQSADHYTYRAEFSTDGGANWTTMIEGVSVRQK